jgi:hypothetical protein
MSPAPGPGGFETTTTHARKRWSRPDRQAERLTERREEVEKMEQSVQERFDEITASLDLDIEDLESLEAPGFWEWGAGVVVGAAAGYGAFALGAALVAT